MVIPDSALWNKATKAGYDYKKVYGVFPEKIGIHFKRLHQFGRTCIIFPELNPIPVSFFAETPPTALESLYLSHHRVSFEPVVGLLIEWDEVYVPGGLAGEVLNSRQIARRAHIKEQEFNV